MVSLKEFEKHYLKKIDLAEIEILISFVIGKPREFILTHLEYNLSKLEENKLKKLVKKRLAGEPIAYLIGEKEFYGLNFRVNKNVLVPRPETELMVEKTLNLIKTIYFTDPKKLITVIDIGTGSGCIIIALAKFLLHNFPALKFYAIDISLRSLVIAKINAQLYNIHNKIKFFHGNLLQPLINNSEYFQNSFTVITANLPYLTPKQIKNSPTIQTEPRLALDGGYDGLKYYRQLIQQLKKPPFANLSWAAFFEIDPTQETKIKKIIKKKLIGRQIKSYPDLAGYTRVIEIRKLSNPL